MTERIAWQGELLSRRRLFGRGVALLAGGLGLVVLLQALPLLVLIGLAFATRGPYGEVLWRFSLDNLARLAGFGILGWAPDTIQILGRSVVLASLTTLFCVLLAFPLAFFIAGRPLRRRYVWLALIAIPMLTNVVIRTYAWFPLLGTHSALSGALRALGLLAPDQAVYPGTVAVYLGMISTSLPFAVLPLYAAVERIDWSLLEAARDLYASPWLVFRHAVLPQVKTALAVAVVLTFVPSLGAFVVPDLLGGARHQLIGNLIYLQFTSSRDWPFGAAVSLGLIVCSLLGLWGYWRSQGSETGGVGR